MKKSLLLISVLLCLLTACGVTSDPKTEAKLDGVWELQDEIDENGIGVMKFNLDSKSHEFTLSFDMFFVDEDDETYYVATILGGGTWCADDKHIESHLDPNKIKFDADIEMLQNMGMTDQEIKTMLRETEKELREELFGETDGLDEIIKLTSTTLITKDDEGETLEYTKVL